MPSATEQPNPLVPPASEQRTGHPSGAPSAWWAGRTHPLRTALTLAAAPVVACLAIAMAGRAIFPEADPTTTRLVAVLVMAAAACLVVGRARAWSRIGAAGPTTWSRPGLLAIPALVALAPLVTGLNLPSPGALGVLVTGYVATGIFEETWHRGVVLDALRALGVRRSALVGGALFAASHLVNMAFGQPTAVTVAQAVGAFCFGIGFSIFRWRTNALWLLVGLHAVGDLLLHITNVHGGALWVFLVGHDTVILLWGLFCLRDQGNRRGQTQRPPAGSNDRRPAAPVDHFGAY